MASGPGTVLVDYVERLQQLAQKKMPLACL